MGIEPTVFCGLTVALTVFFRLYIIEAAKEVVSYSSNNILTTSHRISGVRAVSRLGDTVDTIMSIITTPQQITEVVEWNTILVVVSQELTFLIPMTQLSAFIECGNTRVTSQSRASVIVAGNILIGASVL